MADEDKKVVVPSSADSTIKPSDVTRIAPAAQGSVEPKKLKTIKLKPLKTVAPASSQNTEETISMSRESSSSESQTPSTDEDATIGINRGVTSETVLAPPMPEENTGSPEDDATVKIEKVSKQQQGPSAAPSIPGVKQTIKLRPSSSVSDATAPVATQQPASKQTLKLTPTASPAPSAPQQGQEAEEAPESGSAGSTKKTIKLVAKKPSAPTVKLDSPASTPTVSATSEDAAPSSSKRTLKIRTTSMPPPPAPAQSDMGMATEHGAPPVAEPPPLAGSQQYADQMQGQQADDAPSVLNTIAASISLLALAYFAYQLFSQYQGMFM